MTLLSRAQAGCPAAAVAATRAAAPLPLARARAALRAATPLQRLPCLTQPVSSSRAATWRPLAPVAAAAAAPAVAAAAPARSSDGGAWSRFTALANALTNFFPVFVLGAALWALWRPTSFQWFDKAAITPSLAVTMLGMGLTLTFEDFKQVLATPGRIFAGFALQYTIMPAMAYLVSRAMQLPLAFTIGLCIVGSCPGGTASNVVTYLARADVTLSVAMTTASTLGAVVATPLLTQLLLGTLVPVDATALLVSTLQVVLAPVVVGAAINTAFPRQVAALAPLSALSAVMLIALICGSVVAQNAAAVLQAGPRLLAAIFILHAGGFFCGYAFSKALGIPEKAARTNSIEVGMQNSALGAVLATAHFPAHPLAAVPCAISACMHSVMGSLLAAVWRGRPTHSPLERSLTSMEQEEALMSTIESMFESAGTLAGTAAAAVAGGAAGAVVGAVAGATAGAASVLGRGLHPAHSPGPGHSGSISFRTPGGSGGVAFGRPAAAAALSSGGAGYERSVAGGMRAAQQVAQSSAASLGRSFRQKLSGVEMNQLLGSDF